MEVEILVIGNEILIGKTLDTNSNWMAKRITQSGHRLKRITTIEDDVFLGPSMVFTNIVNPRSAVVRKGSYVETLVGKGASIGANATIICGNSLGEFCFIGAGAVVTKDVPPYALVVGNPGKQVGWMSEFGHRLHFDDQHLAVCPESGDKYELKNGEVSKI